MYQIIAFGITNEEDVIILHEPIMLSEDTADWLSSEEWDGVWKRGLLIIPHPSEEVRERVKQVRILTPVEKLDEQTFAYALPGWRIIHANGVFSFSAVKQRLAHLLSMREEELSRMIDDQIMEYYEEGYIDLGRGKRVLLGECGFILLIKEEK